MWKFFDVVTPFFAPGDGPAGGGAPGGGAPDLSGGGAPGAGGAPGGPAGGGSTVYDLTPDSMVKGSDGKPVKYSDYLKSSGYINQSEFTKKSQAHAAAVKAWEAEKEAATQKLLEEARKLAAAKKTGSGPAEDPLSELRNANYIDGKTAAGMLEAIQQRGIAPLVSAINERDEVIKSLYKDVKQLSGLVQKMQEASGTNALTEKIKGIAKALGNEDPAMVEYLQDLYASHEGPDWDSQFETTAKSKITALQKALREADRRAAAEAKKKLIAGAGGRATPGQKLNEGFKKPSDIANSFAEALGIPD